MKRLVNYNATAQHTGTWLRGYDWNIYGCGTYRQAESEVHAQALMKRFMERLERKLHAPVSFYASRAALFWLRILPNPGSLAFPGGECQQCGHGAHSH